MNARTLFTEDRPITVKTDKTCNVDNQEFLSAIFAKLSETTLPLVVTFPGEPSKGNWCGKPWVMNATHLPDTNNNYFSLSAFKADEQGNYQRRKTLFQGWYCVMLDDVGTKVALEKLQLEPSWLLETSPDNYQAGYLFDTPVTDVTKADELMQAVIEAGLSDPGAGGPSTRLARLPVAFNGKHDPIFPCRLAVWEPNRRYTVEDLIAGFGLQLNTPQVVAASTASSPIALARPTASANAVWQPKPSSNPIIAALQAQELYKKPLGEGKHDITCPWVNEHTNAIDDGCAYFEPSENHPAGGLKCHHGHCAERSLLDLLAFFHIDYQSAKMRSLIRIIDGELPRVVDAAERALADTGCYFQRGGAIVTLQTDPQTDEVYIQTMNSRSLYLALAQATDWQRMDNRKKTWVKKDPPQMSVNILLDAGHYKHLPTLTGLARQPYLRKDGSLVCVPGYDAASQLFGVFNPGEFVISDSPSIEDAKKALLILEELLAEFEFATPYDRSAALSAILTACIRPSLAASPLFHVKAHSPGSGKSYLCQLITAFATPAPGSPLAFPSE
ncbi:MAG: hypothetical protein WDA24_12525, partial [Tissierellales bacterium]